jgi:hypothetical protein
MRMSSASESPQQEDIQDTAATYQVDFVMEAATIRNRNDVTPCQSSISSHYPTYCCCCLYSFSIHKRKYTEYLKIA